ncbi:MAG TPA: peroxiredoxin [Nocardioidaceae bacterium]|nr:peroxiredoxin [Nocardioidaceae bacterium]
MTIDVGAHAPDFALHDQHGRTVRLSDFRGDRLVLIVFYPWSFTGICTSETREIQDSLPQLEDDDVQVLAISCDAMSTQRVFADKEGLTYPVLSDFWPHGEVASAFGVFDAERGAALRGSFLVDREGVVRWRVVNGIGEARTLSDYRAVLGDLVG